MIAYSKEEFPLRFKVFKHTCKYCGVQFFSNRSQSSYDTPTCRVYDWLSKKEKKAKGGTISPKSIDNAPKVPEKAFSIELRPIGKRKINTILWWNEYEKGFKAFFTKRFPNMDWKKVWAKQILTGENKDYSFEYAEDKIEGTCIIFYKLIYEEE